MTRLYHRVVALALALAGLLTPVAYAQELVLLSESRVSDVILSDGLPGGGRWLVKVQPIYDAGQQKLESRRYEIFDATPKLDLDVTWQPDSFVADRPGRIAGSGLLVWRDRLHTSWDPDGVVRTYSGALTNGRPHGAGELVTRDGLAYAGQWRAGRAHGTGRLQLPDGAEYSGSFRNGLAEGQGQYFDATGESFRGRFHAGLRQGAGSTRLPSGLVYQSHWSAGIEDPLSRRVRLAQLDGASADSGQSDIILSVAVPRKPPLPQGVSSDSVIAYTAVSNDDAFQVRPADKTLMNAWKGKGELQVSSDVFGPGRIFGYSSETIDLSAPAFVIRFENRSRAPIGVASLRLNVSRSEPDLQPAIEISSEYECGFALPTVYNIRNFGWSTARNASISLSFGAPGNPAVRKEVGDIDGHVQVNFDDTLRGTGMDINRLGKLRYQGFSCKSGDAQGCLDELRAGRLFGPMASSVKLQGTRVVLPTYGQLSYQWVDAAGTPHDRRSPFFVNVALGQFAVEPPCGAENADVEEIRRASYKLQASGADYSVPIRFRRRIEAGQATAYGFRVTAEKASSHAFRVVATLDDGREISSRPISLLYFKPRYGE